MPQFALHIHAHVVGHVDDPFHHFDIFLKGQLASIAHDAGATIAQRPDNGLIAGPVIQMKRHFNL